MDSFLLTLIKHGGPPSLNLYHSDPEVPVIAPAWMAVLLGVLFGYAVASSLLTYVVLRVVGTLAMVEHVHHPFVPDEADRPLLAPEPTAPTWLPPAVAITSGIRRTLAHLRAEAGSLSLFRGIGYYILYGILENFFNTLFIKPLRPVLWFFSDILVPVFVPLILWALNNAWLHKVISRPSQRDFVTRINEQVRSRAVMKAIGVWAFCRSISSFVPQVLFNIFVLSKFTIGDDQIHFDDNASPKETAFEALGIYTLSVVLPLLLVVPANIMLVRVQAAMLPNADDPIVPFDRTFGGTVVSESTNGGGKLSLHDAWQSFTLPARIRLLKIYVKYFALQITLGVYALVLVLIITLVVAPPETKDNVMARSWRN